MTVQCQQQVSAVHYKGHAMAAASDNDQPDTDGNPLEGLRILLVEDSWHVAQAYKSLLEIVGLDVAGPAGTLADAETLFAQQRPDIAVVDVDLHGIKSYGLIDQLIASNVPTIVVSGYEVLPKLQGRVAAILTKPVRASTLLTVVRRVIAQSGTPKSGTPQTGVPPTGNPPAGTPPTGNPSAT